MFSERMMTSVSTQFGCRVPKGMFGVEIETEGANLPPGAITPYFVGKPDGSLRDGMEYVSGVLQHGTVAQRVNELREVLNKFKAKINPSYRSSTHIHFNMGNKNFKDVLGMMIVWALVEPTVFALMPPGRDGSLFCVSSYDSGELPAFVDQFCSAITDNFYNGFNPRGKYSSLNLTRLGPGEGQVLGTLEYRVFPTSLDGNQIAEWCDWIYNMSEIVAKEEDHSFLNLVRFAEQNPIPFLKMIFGRLPIPEHQAAEYVDFGARTAYEMARVVDKHVKSKKSSRKGPNKPLDHAFPLDIPAIGEAVPADPVANFRPANRLAGLAAGGGGQPVVRPVPVPRPRAGGAAARAARREAEHEAIRQRILGVANAARARGDIEW